MKKMKNLLALLLAVMMVLGLCACGNNEGGTTEPDTSTTTQSQNTEPQKTDPQESEPQETEPDAVEPVDYVYTVQVLTADGEGIEGVFVQICAGSTCVPKKTDATGLAGYETEITGDGELTAKMISIPEGYELAEGETAEIVLTDGETNAVFVLQEKN